MFKAPNWLVFILFITNPAVIVFAQVKIYRSDLRALKQRCSQWSNIKEIAFKDRIARRTKNIPVFVISQKREELMASEDFKLIDSQARITKIKIVSCSFFIFLIFAIVVAGLT